MMDCKTKQPIRILVADDEAGILDSYRMILDATKQAADSDINDLKSKFFGGKNTKVTLSDEPEFDIFVAG